MKVYSLQKYEGLNELLGYQCDSCATYVAGEDLPSDFIIDHEEHFCFECQVTCKYCQKIFSTKYLTSWFKNDLCENCQDSFKEVKNEIL